MAPSSNSSKLRSPLVPIFLTVLVDVLAMTLVLPLLPYYAQQFGASPVVVAALLASFSVCQLVSGPVLGRISDGVGRKPTLLVSQMGTFAGFLMMGFAGSLWMLFAGRMIDGLTAGNLSIAQAYISDVTKPEERTRAYGLIGIAFGAGFLIGPAASGVLAHRFGYSAPVLGAAGLSMTSILVTWRLLKEPPRVIAIGPQARAEVKEGGAEAGGASSRGGRIEAIKELMGRPQPRFWLIEFFAYALSFATLTGGLAMFLERRLDFHVEQTGYVYAFSGLVGGMLQGGIGRLVKRLGEARLALAGLIAMAVGYGLLAAVSGVPVLAISIVIGGAGAAVVRPSLTTLLTTSVGRGEQGMVLGVSQSITSVSQIVGPLVAGWLINHKLLSGYGLAAGGFALAGALLLLRGYRAVMALSTRASERGEAPGPTP